MVKVEIICKYAHNLVGGAGRGKPTSSLNTLILVHTVDDCKAKTKVALQL